MARVGAVLLLLCGVARAEDSRGAPPAAEVPRGEFIDEAVRDELNARRRYRGVQERVFQKALRHELSAFGGGYTADLTSSSYLLGAAYTFHISEDLALEAYFGYTRQRAELVRIVESRFATDLIREDARVFLYGGHLLWNLAYGKLRWFHARVSRFDFYLALGGGITDNSAARTLTFSGGFGLKFYPTSWFAVRLDVRDQLLNQELLGESRIVNNLLTTLGASVFLPFHP
ncbi:MAG TPA: outer membrane beta-barrel domain-containing protein [Polyangiales bacterium]|nr:outer membrane beta-barrel domain-containing protein [Polyangiales bacterium]